MREDLQQGRVSLPNDAEPPRNLITPAFTTRNGRVLVEFKEDTANRLGRSPNKRDACVYWNFVRHRKPLSPPEDTER